MLPFYHKINASVSGFNYGKLLFKLSNKQRDGLAELTSAVDGGSALNGNTLRVSIPKRNAAMYASIVIGSEGTFSLRISEYEFEDKNGDDRFGWYAALVGCELD